MAEVILAIWNRWRERHAAGATTVDAIGSIVDFSGSSLSTDALAQPGDEWRLVGIDMLAAVHAVKHADSRLADEHVDDPLCLDKTN